MDEGSNTYAKFLDGPLPGGSLQRSKQSFAPAVTDLDHSVVVRPSGGKAATAGSIAQVMDETVHFEVWHRCSRLVVMNINTITFVAPNLA